MSLKDNNIEELFRSGLEDFELPVNDAMWSSISNQIGHPTVSAAAKSGFLSATSKTIILSTIGLGSVIGGGIVLSHYLTNTTKEVTSINSIEKDETEHVSENSFEATSSSKSEYSTILDHISQNENEVESVVNDGTGSTSKPTKSVVSVTSKNVQYKSVAEMFLSPPSKSVTSSNKPSDNKVVSTPTPTFTQITTNPSDYVTVKVEEVKPEQIIASISAMPVGGFAPLEVSFTQQSENTQIHWDFGDGKQSKENKPTHVFEKFGKYTVTLTLTDSKGKQYKDTRIIEVLPNSAVSQIPNIFTPNNDGDNDYFYIQSKNIEEYHLMVMDLKGNLMYTTKNIDDKWDGITMSGTLIPEGKYVVIIVARGTDGKIFEFNTSLKVKI